MASVQRIPGESFDKLVSRFKKQCNKEHIVSEFMAREFYESPKEVKKKKQKQNKKRREVKKDE